MSTASGLVFFIVFVFVILGSFINTGDASLVTVERGIGLNSGGPVTESDREGFLQGAFLGEAGFAESQASVLNYSSYDESAVFLGYLTPIGTSRLSLASYSYVVRPYDTLSQIAEDFDISADKLRRANPSAVRLLKVGQEIIIPRSDGVVGVSTADSDGGTYVAGFDEVLGEPVRVLPNLDSYFDMPTKGWNWGELHDENGVDIANACGTQIFAAAPGRVIEESSKDFWNRGYGNYLLIEHENGIRTRYAHTLRNTVSIGDEVGRGQEIALMGNTGNTNGPTGCHLHFEVVNARNPFVR